MAHPLGVEGPPSRLAVLTSLLRPGLDWPTTRRVHEAGRVSRERVRGLELVEADHVGPANCSEDLALTLRSEGPGGVPERSSTV